jgi:YD repeat-containing protein
MKTLYDPESDALYLRFSDARVVESEEVSEGVVLDYDAEGRIVAIELLEARTHLAAGTEFPTAAE